MKRILCCFLVIISLLSLWGCDEDNAEASANFYYVRSAYIYGQEDGVIAAEPFDTAEFTDDREILSVYLDGPKNVDLVSPFPQGTKIIDFSYKGETLYITLSSHVVALSKAKQVLACTCFARTAMELTGVKAVHFETDSSTVARMDPILIDEDTFLLYDDYASFTTEETN